MGVVGFGTIGERIADGLALQDDMELVGVVDVAPTLPVLALVEPDRGYPIYCALPDRIPEMEKAGIPITGTLEDLLSQVDMVCDATTPGIGMKNRPIYEKHSVKSTFQGGEVNEVGELLYSTAGNYHAALGKDYIKLVSCNTTAIIWAVAAMDNAFGVERGISVIIRRAADPSEIHKGPIDAAIPGKVPSHQSVDLMRVMPHIDAFGVIVTVPTTHGHVISMHCTLKTEPTQDAVLEALRTGPRIRMFRMADGFLSNTYIFDYMRDLGRHRADMYEVGIWEESIALRGKEAFWLEHIPQESIVIPENIDAVRAAMRMQPTAEEAMAKTDRGLGIA